MQLGIALARPLQMQDAGADVLRNHVHCIRVLRPPARPL